jgi:N-acetyl-gamma-glutamyl-phosphate reductase
MSTNPIKVGVIGATGYTGGELLRLLVNHPNVAIDTVFSRNQSGKSVSEIHPDLLELTSTVFVDQLNHDLDVLFLCTPHGKAKEFLQNLKIKVGKIIDLSADHRDLKEGFVYGLCESNRESITQAKKVANPGCFATAIQLGLLPAASAKLLNSEIHVTAITGSTGAGNKLTDTSHFSWRANNVGVYKVFNHQHMDEINQTIQPLCEGPCKIHFVPMRGPFTRGILASIYWTCEASATQVIETYQNFYKGHPFTEVVQHDVDLKQVVGTNRCLIHINKIGDQIHITSAIDNLLKGAVGQAVQNMNLMYGLNESSALKLKAMVY